MDKVRAFMRVMWIQRFWVLSIVGTLAALICWQMAAGKLQAEFTTNKGAIEGKFSEMSSITGKSFHGNPDVNKKEREEAVKIADSVKSLWQKLYDHQRKEVLYWPKALGTEFLTYIENRKFDTNIPSILRDKYLNYIKTQFDALVELVDAQKMTTDQAGMFGGAEGRGGGMEFSPEMAAGQPGMMEDYLVQWVDQGLLREKLDFGRQPTSREIWVRQEDLWVYETLLKAIKNTNDERGASRPDNTAIRVISSLQVGKEAAVANAQQPMIIMPAIAAGGGDMYGDMRGGEGEMAPSPEMGGEMFGDMRGGEGEMGGGAQADAALLSMRYVDAEGKPLPDASTGLAVEYRRLPVRMVLLMDERWIPTVLVECANATLPIEVQRLRINPERSGAGFDNAAGGGGGMGGRGMGGGEMMMSRDMSGLGAATLSPVDMAKLATVEIQGLVYIYNAPDATSLAVPGAEEEAPAPDAVGPDIAAADGTTTDVAVR